MVKGFTLVEFVVVIAVFSLLLLIVIPRYRGCFEKASKTVCNANCHRLEQMYYVYLLMENRNDTTEAFDDFLRNYDKIICPSGGVVLYINGKVKCSIHSVDIEGGVEEEEN